MPCPSYCQEKKCKKRRQYILEFLCLLHFISITDHCLKQNYWSNLAQMFLCYVENKKITCIFFPYLLTVRLLREFTTGLAASILHVAGYNIYYVYATKPYLAYTSQTEF